MIDKRINIEENSFGATKPKTDQMPDGGSCRQEQIVSLQTGDWQVIKKVGNPDETDRYLIVYRYKDMTELKYFIADYDTHYGWSCELRDVEFIAWRKIPEFDSASILSN